MNVFQMLVHPVVTMARTERYSSPGAILGTKLNIYQFFCSKHNVAVHQVYALKDKENKWSQTADNLSHSRRDHVEYWQVHKIFINESFRDFVQSLLIGPSIRQPLISTSTPTRCYKVLYN
jgi:hypothetical protein